MEEKENYYSTGKVKHTKITKPEKTYAKPLLAVVVLVIVAATGFFSGVAYESGHAKSAAASTNSRTDRAGAFGGGRGGYSGYDGQRPTFGSVTAVSSSSISVQGQGSSTTTTFSITSSTNITDNGSAVAASDIKVGDTVIIRASTTSTSQAGTIQVNPNFGGDEGSSNAPSTSTDSDVTSD
jgi:hypothetical protein